MRKNSLKNLSLSLSTIVLLSMAGCSGGSSSGSDIGNAISTAFSGVGIDGILVGSTVCIDVDNSNTCDAGEPSAITDSEGKFNIAETTLTGPLLLVGGVDNSTGQAFTGSLKAPVGSSVVTPLTAAIQSLVESGKSVEDAEANVKAAMGLTNVDVNLTSFDPYNEVSVNAQAVLAKQTQLQVLVHSATVTVAGADDSTDVNSTMSSVFDAIVGNFNGATGVVVLDATTIAAATKTAADVVYVNKPAARVAAKVVAQTSAENSVRDADSAQTAISSGTPSEATGNLDAAITKVNTSAETELKAAAVAAKTAADGLPDAKIAEIEALQQAQQAKEAEIAAAKAAQAQAEADLAAAKAAALADATDRAKYEAYLAAEAAAQKAAVEKSAAEEAAALAAQLAAAEEIAISAEAAQREAEATAALAQAVAEKAEAELRQAAAEQAETDAKAATDLAAAQAAVAAAEVGAQTAIAQAQVNSNNEIAKFIFEQMSNDLNTTKAAIVDLNSSALDANITQAQTVYDTTAATLVSLQLLVDNSSTDVNQSLIYKDEIQASATNLGTLLDVMYTLKYDEEIAVAEQLSLTAKLTRIQTIENELIAIDANVTQRLNDFNSTAVTDDIAIIEEIAATYSEAQQAADDANASFQEAQNILNQQELISIAALYEVTIAKVDVNETAAQEAQATVYAALVIFEEQFVILETKVAEIAAIRVEVEAIRDAAIAATPPPANTFSTVTDLFFLRFENDNPFVGKIVLNNGSIQEFYYDVNSSTWLENNVTSDVVLNSSGAWVTPDNSSYSIDTTTGIITLADGTQKRLDSVLALPGSSFESEFNANTPVDANISFLDGDVAYITSSKDVEQYVLYYKALDYSTGASFATLEEYVNSGINFAGYQDAAGDFHGVGFDVVPSGAVVSSFSAGDSGDLVLDANLSDVVGSWSVVTLPNTSDLAIELIKAAGKEDAFGGAEANLMAVYNSEVYLGEHKQATVDFVQELYPPFNESAATRIIEFFDVNSSVVTDTNVTVDTNTTTDTNTTIARTIPEIGSWYEPTSGIHLTFLNDASYYYAINNPGTNGVIGGIELGWFDVNSTDYSLSNFQTVINSNEGDTLIGSAITYDATSDTLLINNGTTTVTLQRDDGNTSRPEVGTWIAYEPATNDIVIFSLHSDGTYISSNLDINTSGFRDFDGGTYNAFELGAYTSSVVDTNLTLTIEKAPEDFDGVFGPPAGDISFDITNFPTIVNPNITFEKVVATP